MPVVSAYRENKYQLNEYSYGIYIPHIYIRACLRHRYTDSSWREHGLLGAVRGEHVFQSVLVPAPMAERSKA